MAGEEVHPHVIHHHPPAQHIWELTVDIVLGGTAAEKRPEYNNKQQQGHYNAYYYTRDFQCFLHISVTIVKLQKYKKNAIPQKK
jgi:hypothetical protein